MGIAVHALIMGICLLSKWIRQGRSCGKSVTADQVENMFIQSKILLMAA
jgi:hypothetical protein